jgi:hypothetical protein
MLEASVVLSLRPTVMPAGCTLGDKSSEARHDLDNARSDATGRMKDKTSSREFVHLDVFQRLAFTQTRRLSN